MPIPVMTTRLMNASSASRSGQQAPPPSTPARLHHFVAEQADLEIHCPIDDRAVCREPAVSDAKHKLAAHDPLDVDAVGHPLNRREHLAREFEFTQPERASPTGRAQPAQEEAKQLPKRIKTKAAGHHRIALEVAWEEPQVRLKVEHGTNQALAVLAPGFCDLRNAIEHEHGRERQLGVARTEQLAARTRQ